MGRRGVVLAVIGLLVAGCGTATRIPPPPKPAPARSQTFDNSQPWPHPKSKVASAPARHHPRAVASAAPAPPHIVQMPIPFGAQRKAEMAAYAERHYGISTYRLVDPHVIVEHYTETATFQEAYNTFVPDVPDSELHELPGTCAHFIVDRDGTIYQLVPTTIMCRHTVGLNWTAIGIEHVGMSDQDILGNPPQLHASLQLTHWLACKYGIDVGNVIGHNESLTSPYHHELVPALQTQTHADMQKPDMDRYRAMLARMGSC